MCKILVDADACPVKEQIFNVGFRFNVNIILVANSYFRIPETPIIEFKLVDMGFDAADNWIAKNTNLSSIVITSDILLAERCLKIGTFSVISPYGTIFSKQNIRATGTAAFSPKVRIASAGPM